MSWFAQRSDRLPDINSFCQTIGRGRNERDLLIQSLAIGLDEIISDKRSKCSVLRKSSRLWNEKTVLRRACIQVAVRQFTAPHPRGAGKMLEISGLNCGRERRSSNYPPPCHERRSLNPWVD